MADGERGQLPKAIGRYQIVGSLGAGAMGAVYKGFDPLIKRTLAIKTIRLDIPRGSDEYKMFLERFYQEARISGTLSHPNIVTLFDIGEDNGVPFLALEFIEGETIESMVARGVKFRPEKVLGLVSQIAAALDYAHSRGVIHRDVKPANLLVFEEERVKVTDFGIAKLADSEMTKAGQLLGTPSYMSPEQAMGEKLDGRSDIFSLGVCAFEMLCGQQPFPGNNVTAILYKLVHMDPIEPDNLEMQGLIPQKWHEVFPRVLAKKRDDRYQTAADFVRDLEFCLGTWFSGLGEEVVGDEAAAAPPPPPAPAPPATAPPAPAPPAAPPVAAPPEPSPGLAARNSDDPSVVVSMDEIQDAIAYMAQPAARPAGPAVPEDDDIPETLAMKPGEQPEDEDAATVMVARPSVAPPASDSLPPTLPVQRPAMPAVPEEDDLPPTVAVPRPPVEKTIVLPPPTAGGAAPATPPAPVAAAPASPPAASKPSSAPPFRAGSLPPFRPASGLGSRPRMTGALPPRQGGPRSVAPAPVEEFEEELPPRRRLPLPLLAGGAVVLALALGTIGFFVIRGRATTAASSGAVATGNGSIQVTTTPPGATVKLYDVGHDAETGRLTGLAPGVYEVIAELDGHEPAFERLTLREGDPAAQVSLQLEPSTGTMGEADILSRPAGASVYMDGQKIGQSPLRDLKLKVGNRRFRLTTDGYDPYVEFLKVEAGKPARLDARMSPAGTAATTSAAASRGKGAGGAAPAAGGVDTARVYQVNEVDTQPRKLSGDAFKPSLRPGEARSITLSWVVNETGAVSGVEVVESGGKALDDGVSRAIGQWKYEPGLKQGVKVKVKLAVKFTFRAG